MEEYAKMKKGINNMTYILLLIICLTVSACENKYKAVSFGDKGMVIDTETGEVWVTEAYETPWGGNKIKLVPIGYPEKQSEYNFYTPNWSRSNDNLQWYEIIIRNYRLNKLNNELKE